MSRAARPALAATLSAALLCTFVLGACSSTDDASAPTSAQVRTALARHATAVREHDRAAFLAGVADVPAAAAFRRAQRAEFANLRHVPLRRWTYTLASPVRAGDAQAAARARFGPSARIVKVVLHVAIEGVDPVASTHELWWTVARIDGQVVLCADDGLTRQGGVSWQGPWDFGPVAVVHGTHSLVIGGAGQGADLRRIADVVDQAVPAVSAVWGTRWARDVLVIVPTSSAALQAALGNDGPDATAGTSGSGGADDTAVTVTDGQDPLTGQAEGARIVIEQSAFDGLTPIGRHIVFTHEITHVASAAATGGASPRWLVEGLAEYVANLHTGLTVRSTARELVTRIRRDGVPRALPTDSVFDSASGAAAAYEQAWLACRLIASQAGPGGLVRLYRQVGASGLSTQDAVSGALRSVLHQTTAGFTARWRSYLRTEVG